MKKENFRIFGKKIGGAYNLAYQGKIFTEGSWAEYGSFYGPVNSPGNSPGNSPVYADPNNRLMIFTPYEPDLPYTSPREHLATLEKCPVSDIFKLVQIEKKTIRGEGTTALTNEKLEWSMWYKTSP